MGTAQMDIILKPCEKCGEIMECNSPNKKICYDCRVQRQNEFNHKRYTQAYRRKHKNCKVKISPIQKRKCLICGEKFLANATRSYCDFCRKGMK